MSICSLRSHARTHSGIKPYQCETCQRQFAVKSNLTKHLAVHSGIKAYACEDCGRRFSFSANLRSHMRIHSGEKPYECADCGHRSVGLIFRVHLILGNVWQSL